MLLALLLAARPASADPQGLTPLQVTSAGVIRVGTLQLQADTSFSHDRYESPGPDLYRGSLTAKLGAVRGLELDIGVPYGLGTQSSANTGSVPLGFQYRFNQQRRYLPAFAVRGGYVPSFGSRYRFARYELRGIATKWLGSSERSPRSHLNFNWYHSTEPSRTRRHDQIEFGIAYTRLLNASTALAIDLVHGAKSDVGKNQTIVDLGIRHERGDWRFSAGVGAGIDQQSPALRMFVGVQRNFSVY